MNITSKDGTTLAVDTTGQGTPLILIGGAFNDRSTVAGLAAELATGFRVVTYDRRGRSASDDKSDDYLVANEIADLAAVVEYFGGHASVFGHSSGAALAMEAVVRGLPIDRLAVYEPPYRVDDNLPTSRTDVNERLKSLVAAGDGPGAVELFMAEVIGVPAEGIAGMRAGEVWPFLVGQAPSLPYDVLVMQPWRPMPVERIAGIGVPLLAVYGDRTEPGLAAATKAVAAAVPGARLEALAGEDHAVLQRPAALAPLLAEFFG
ncbi:alpha/beta hydrolase [Kitasatospora acidiphila]|uniref:Alpha/beta hydrolase n=1 Tax=Kitasatospora acidiphila TaxID=2567942 RepID=A0A540VY94_9ACTN|nr:alpha/beta hydrolase [Kitasatospora acidiphila]TQF01736.1 alpha/beta hydrolase [Kitasatospora acidiphila]